MNRLISKSILAIGILALVSCTSQNLEMPLPGQRQKTSDAASATSSGDGGPQTDKDGVVTNGTQTTVDPPVQTAGAFLVCRADVEPMPDPTMAMGGCKLVREDVKYDGWRTDFISNAIVVPEKEGQTFAPEIQAAMDIQSMSDEFDAWHWRVVYPRSAPLMLFQLELTPVAGGATETVRAFLKGQEWRPIDDEDALISFVASLTATGKQDVVTVRASSKDESFFMIPASFKATLNLGTTEGLVVTFAGTKPSPFGPCRFEAVGNTEVTGDGVVPTSQTGPGSSAADRRNRSVPDPATVYFEMKDTCKDAKAGQIRRMKEVEFTLQRPKVTPSTTGADVIFNVLLPGLEQLTPGDN